MLLVDGGGDVVESARLLVTEADLDDDGDPGGEDLPPVVRPAELGGRDEDPVVVAQRRRGRRASGAVGLAGPHDETDLERCRQRPRVGCREGRELVRRAGGHEQRADVGGIRPRAPVEVLADGHVERGQARREHRGVVDEAVEERREGRP